MSLTRSEVIAAREELAREGDQLRAAQMMLKTKREILYLQCGHPDLKGYTERDGSRSNYCEDCGYDR